MRSYFFSTTWALLWIATAATPVFAQGRWGGHDDRPASPEEAQQRMQRSESMLQELDTNHNGMIDANEATGRSKFMLDRVLQRSGVEASYPLPISRVREGLQRAYQIPASQPGQGVPGQPPQPGQPWPPQPGPPMPGQPWPPQPGQPVPGQPPQPGQGVPGQPWQPQPGQPVPGQPWPPQPGQPWPPQPGQPPVPAGPVNPPSLVPGFGEAQTLKAPPGFGVVAVAAPTTPGAPPVAAPQMPPPGGPPAGGPPPSGLVPGAPPPSAAPDGQKHEEEKNREEDKKREEDKRFRDYAKQLLSQYDKNKNGVLDKDECAGMSNNPKGADLNSDGFVSLDELTAWVAEQGRKSGGHGGKGPPRRDEPGKPGEGDKKDGDKKKGVYRLHSSRERLPTGLPDWFARKDKDGDAQISMAEYCDDWSESKVAEFTKYDLNGDGVITPSECLKVDKPAKK